MAKRSGANQDQDQREDTIAPVSGPKANLLKIVSDRSLPIFAGLVIILLGQFVVVGIVVDGINDQVLSARNEVERLRMVVSDLQGRIGLLAAKPKEVPAYIPAPLVIPKKESAAGLVPITESGKPKAELSRPASATVQNIKTKERPPNSAPATLPPEQSTEKTETPGNCKPFMISRLSSADFIETVADEKKATFKSIVELLIANCRGYASETEFSGLKENLLKLGGKPAEK